MSNFLNDGRPQKKKGGWVWARGRCDLAAGLVCGMFADQGEAAQGEADKSHSHGICFSFQILLDPIRPSLRSLDGRIKGIAFYLGM